MQSVRPPRQLLRMHPALAPAHVHLPAHTDMSSQTTPSLFQAALRRCGVEDEKGPDTVESRASERGQTGTEGSEPCEQDRGRRFASVLFIEHSVVALQGSELAMRLGEKVQGQFEKVVILADGRQVCR